MESIEKQIAEKENRIRKLKEELLRLAEV